MNDCRAAALSPRTWDHNIPSVTRRHSLWGGPRAGLAAAGPDAERTGSPGVGAQKPRPPGQDPGREAGTGRGLRPREPWARPLPHPSVSRHGPCTAPGPCRPRLFHPGLWHRSRVRALYLASATSWRDAGVWWSRCAGGIEDEVWGREVEPEERERGGACRRTAGEVRRGNWNPERLRAAAGET